MSSPTFARSPAFGLDFGTTNSAIARVDPDGRPELARFPAGDESQAIFRSVLYFDSEDEGESVRVHAGPDAIARYLGSEEKSGRLVQSLKSFLASRLFSATTIFGAAYRLEDLIGRLLASLREQAECHFQAPVEHAVVGRPVHFVNADSEEDEALALTRLEAALHNAGFRDVTFEYEPVGAAYHYEQSLERDELILIADFGGGTSDFSLLRVGPAASRRAAAQRSDSGQRRRGRSREMPSTARSCATRVAPLHRTRQPSTARSSIACFGCPPGSTATSSAGTTSRS